MIKIKKEGKMYIDENSKPKEKLKAWYLFTDDFIAGTQHLTNEAVGIYIRLLCWNWNKRCSGIPCSSMTYYRIANCISESEKNSCDLIIQEFFVKVKDHYQNERQLEEFIYITNRMEASKKNGRLGGRPKKPSQNLDKTPITPTTTPTPIDNPKKIEKIYSPFFADFWEKVLNKVSKGIAEKNYLKLDDHWIVKPFELARLYNEYYESVDDKKFAKHPAFWLSAKKYLDETVKETKVINTFDSQYKQRVRMFKEAINGEKNCSNWLKEFARKNLPDVKRAVNENQFTKEQAIKTFELNGMI